MSSPSFGDFAEMATELADLVLAGIKTATASFLCGAQSRRGSESTLRPADFVIVSDGESSTGSWDLAPHIRALLPSSGLAR
jgi:uncharacterized protein YhfF